MKVEDEYHCSKRLLALATVFFLFILTQAPGWCLIVTFTSLSNQIRYHQSGIDRYLKAAAATIYANTGLTSDMSVAVVLHPDGSTFRQHGFPQWSSAVYRDGEIHLRNPYALLNKGILENTVSHELFHAIIDHHDISLPVWFEEGFANYLFPVSLPETNLVLKNQRDFRDQALFFYVQSRDAVMNLLKGKTRGEIQYFFLLCRKTGFPTAFDNCFQATILSSNLFTTEASQGQKGEIEPGKPGSMIFNWN